MKLPQKLGALCYLENSKNQGVFNSLMRTKYGPMSNCYVGEKLQILSKVPICTTLSYIGCFLFLKSINELLNDTKINKT